MALLCAFPVIAVAGPDSPAPSSFGPALWEVLSLQTYNTRLVVLSTTLLGLAAGFIGSFLLLRKRSLMGDALSHACLPGIGLMFLIMIALGGDGKTLHGLLLGATVTGALGVGTVLLIRNTTRIKDDTAMGIVLSVFFGLGVVILGMLQGLPGAGAAGLESFIYGKTASMIRQDFLLISATTIVTTIALMIFLKEFTILCFDEAFARSQGWPVHTIDMIMLGLVTAVTVVGLQAVGLVLIIAFLIIPAAAARFWTNDLKRMLVLAGLLGALSGWLGSAISALLPRMPAGAVIVLVAATIFLFSLLCGSARGVFMRAIAHHRLQRKIERQHLLRAVFELVETGNRANGVDHPVNNPVPVNALRAKRSWTRRTLQRAIRRAKKEDHIDRFDGTEIRLSEAGFGEATRITRNHRLWEIYLITHADVAPQHVDRDADRVEHVLDPDLVHSLEQELIRRGRAPAFPASPHRIQPGQVAP